LTKQEALGAREPLQAGLPVGAVVGSARVKWCWWGLRFVGWRSRCW
jgi:hypothetical protein